MIVWIVERYEDYMGGEIKGIYLDEQNAYNCAIDSIPIKYNQNDIYKQNQCGYEHTWRYSAGELLVYSHTIDDTIHPDTIHKDKALQSMYEVVKRILSAKKLSGNDLEELQQLVHVYEY